MLHRKERLYFHYGIMVLVICTSWIKFLLRASPHQYNVLVVSDGIGEPDGTHAVKAWHLVVSCSEQQSIAPTEKSVWHVNANPPAQESGLAKEG